MGVGPSAGSPRDSPSRRREPPPAGARGNRRGAPSGRGCPGWGGGFGRGKRGAGLQHRGWGGSGTPLGRRPPAKWGGRERARVGGGGEAPVGRGGVSTGGRRLVAAAGVSPPPITRLAGAWERGARAKSTRILGSAFPKEPGAE